MFKNFESSLLYILKKVNGDKALDMISAIIPYLVILHFFSPILYLFLNGDDLGLMFEQLITIPFTASEMIYDLSAKMCVFAIILV